MTRLGYANPLIRIGRTIQGWLDPPKPGGGAPRELSVIGHRGAPRVAPENTIASFEKAIEVGADAIETDVCVTRDGCFVLWHDADPDDVRALVRQTGGEGLLYSPGVPALGSPWRRPVCELDLGCLREHYGYTRRENGLLGLLGGDTQPEVSIAVLEDLLEWVLRDRRARHVFLDIKLAPEQSQAAAALLRLVRQHCTGKGFPHDLMFHFLSPQAEIIEALLAESRRAALPSAIKLCADFELPGVLRFAPPLGVRHVSMGWGERKWVGFLREVSQVLASRNAGVFDSLVTWTVNDEAKLKELVEFRVDGVITDDPALLRRFVGEHGGRA
jgi:glycerophosphoryl diester phosphodiesterase